METQKVSPMSVEVQKEDEFFGWLKVLDSNGEARGLVGRIPAGFAEELGRRWNAHEGLVEALRTLKALAKRLEVVHSDTRYKAVWQSYQMHAGVYSEPTYTAEFEAALSLLAQLEGK
jgi:hypothetical protein